MMQGREGHLMIHVVMIHDGHCIANLVPVVIIGVAADPAAVFAGECEPPDRTRLHRARAKPDADRRDSHGGRIHQRDLKGVVVGRRGGRCRECQRKGRGAHGMGMTLHAIPPFNSAEFRPRALRQITSL